MKLRTANILDYLRSWKIIFLILTAIAIVVFLIFSNRLIKELAQQERERMAIWASATERLAQAGADSDFDFLLYIIQQNNSIPVMVVDSTKSIIEYRNFNLPDKKDKGEFYSDLSEKNRTYLSKRLDKAVGNRSMREAAKENPHFIEVAIDADTCEYIYYEDSIFLRRLSYYPYIQLVVTILLIVIIYVAVMNAKRAEQNRVWVGLSKETAHQLGTPISSLMAWNEFLGATGTDGEVVAEIDKDVKRLGVIAERFSKIGSQPELQLEYLNEVVSHALDYMKSRISGHVDIEMHLDPDDHGVMLSVPLFAWVMENLTKNAVDAMDGAGRIDITTGSDGDKVFIEVSDTGKGIARKNFKKVFKPGFTTKKRGWGLGLTLVKRIVEEYHRGTIFVKQSEQGKGTTFRIELPSAH